MKPIAPVVYVFLAVILLMNAVLGAMMWHQYVVRSWPTVEGVVTSTGRERSVAGSRFVSCPSIEFRYEVDGVAYESDRYRSGRFCSTSSQDVDSILRDFPAGEPTGVYVNPEDPAEAYLDAGIGRIEHLGLMALLPFNAFALGWLLEIAARVLAGRSLTPGVRYRGPTAALPRIPPLSFMLGTLLVAGFFLAGIAILGFESLSLERFESIWKGLGALAVTALIGKSAWNLLRPRRIVVDPRGWTLPDGSRVSRDALAGVSVSAGKANPPHPTYHKVLLLVDASRERSTVELVELASEDEAERLAAWIERGPDAP